MKKRNLLIFSVIFVASGFGQVRTVNDGYGDYILVPAGLFLMGNNFNEADSNALPVHKVNLSDYYIGKYEVTNGEYNKFIDDGGYTNKEFWTAGGFEEYGSQPLYWTKADFNGHEIYGGGIPGNDNFPVVGVSWYEAHAYCEWLSEKTGKTYRLPTEAEWEKAARGTDQRRFPWGNEIENSLSNYTGNSDITRHVGYYNGTTYGNVKTNSNASPYGVFDMIGNVWEWCADWYGENYYLNSPPDNPRGPKTGTFRILRGGDSDGIHYTYGRFSEGNPTWRHPNIGFRCVRDK